MAAMEMNARGIPRAPFVDAVENFLGGGENAESLLKKFNDTLVTYKRMEATFQSKKKNLEFKLPELEKSLRVAETLHSKRASISKQSPQVVQFGLADSLFAEAKVSNVENVGLWLGANVMLEYPLEEAVQVISEKLKIATESLKIVSEDLEFLREQVTTMEVNIARVFNWDVKRRKIAGASSSS